ncbi:hypothetical protein AMP2_gp082 [Pseudomonas phage vB_Pae_AM.P2]|uniref:Uncharacterized protein n=1 Tax=Pseudomonas phage vB_Pae_AM.P2 TaxID=2731695 RepID=A0A7S6B6I0_9CAUD|nr:hypothetical protein AMP2_gp082 [Pseudomonas phage vB_Pae_AM.P2]
MDTEKYSKPGGSLFVKAVVYVRYGHLKDKYFKERNMVAVTRISQKRLSMCTQPVYYLTYDALEFLKNEEL